jgi:adenylate cyclase
MDRIWQWAWDRYAARYSWALCAVAFALLLPAYLMLSFIVVAYENSDRYVEAAAATVVAMPLLVYVYFLPGLGQLHLVEQWAAGHNVDRTSAMDATYVTSRGAVARGLGSMVVGLALLFVVVGALAGATESRLVQYGILGACWGAAAHLIGVHSIVEGALRPARVAIAGDTGIGDSLPRSRPTFATWSNISMLAVAFGFAIGAAMLGAAFNQVSEYPVLAVVIACVAIGFAVPITVGFGFAPSLRPIRDLAEGTKRVAAGDYSQRPDWLSGNDFRPRSAPTSTQPWRRDCSNRATMSSPESAAR